VLEVIYPVAGVAKLKAVIDEDRAKGTLDRRIQTVMRASYASHSRRMLPPLLSVLEFQSNNTQWRPILDALTLIGSNCIKVMGWTAPSIGVVMRHSG
jgi:hypothetical protein